MAVITKTSTTTTTYIVIKDHIAAHSLRASSPYYDSRLLSRAVLA